MKFTKDYVAGNGQPVWLVVENLNGSLGKLKYTLLADYGLDKDERLFITFPALWDNLEMLNAQIKRKYGFKADLEKRMRQLLIINALEK